MIREKIKAQLDILIELQNEVVDVHPIYNTHYPVTIVRDGSFYIYDVPVDHLRYQFIKSEPCTFPLPKFVRAAFPLSCYDNKASVIVTGDVFDNKEGYATVLHEFVHCAQIMDCEFELKHQLKIAQEYMRKNDHMWEINHPFPYTSPEFIELFTSYLDSLKSNEYVEVLNIRRQFEQIMDKNDVEYLLWQEWKEGLARFLENKIHNLVGNNENHYGSAMPYNRISFYESGSRYISLIERANPGAISDIKELFLIMKRDVFPDST